MRQPARCLAVVIAGNAGNTNMRYRVVLQRLLHPSFRLSAGHTRERWLKVYEGKQRDGGKRNATEFHEISWIPLDFVLPSRLNC